MLTASNIVVVNSSTKIIPHIYNGHHCRNSRLKWPKKQVLPKKWQVIFNDIIRSIIKQQLQSTPLGKWHSDGHQICQYRLDDEGKVKTFTKLSKLQGIDFDCYRWRYKKWTEDELKKIVELLESDNLCIIGDGSVKDQWGAVAWMICSKSSFSEVCTITHPVDGPPSNMKQI